MSDENNLAEDILEMAAKEPIEAVVIGERETDDHRFRVPEDLVGKLISWDRARPLLDYYYDGGFGSPDHPPILVWTATRVLFATCYDGATSLASVPRNPTETRPHFFGGW